MHMLIIQMMLHKERVKQPIITDKHASLPAAYNNHPTGINHFNHLSTLTTARKLHTLDSCYDTSISLTTNKNI